MELCEGKTEQETQKKVKKKRLHPISKLVGHQWCEGKDTLDQILTSNLDMYNNLQSFDGDIIPRLEIEKAQSLLRKLVNVFRSSARVKQKTVHELREHLVLKCKLKAALPYSLLQECVSYIHNKQTGEFLHCTESSSLPPNSKITSLPPKYIISSSPTEELVIFQQFFAEMGDASEFLLHFLEFFQVRARVTLCMHAGAVHRRVDHSMLFVSLPEQMDLNLTLQELIQKEYKMENEKLEHQSHLHGKVQFCPQPPECSHCPHPNQSYPEATFPKNVPHSGGICLENSSLNHPGLDHLTHSGTTHLEYPQPTSFPGDSGTADGGGHGDRQENDSSCNEGIPMEDKKDSILEIDGDMLFVLLKRMDPKKQDRVQTVPVDVSHLTLLNQTWILKSVVIQKEKHYVVVCHFDVEDQWFFIDDKYREVGVDKWTPAVFKLSPGFGKSGFFNLTSYEKNLQSLITTNGFLFFYKRSK